MNENIKKLIESLPDEGVDCKGKEWVSYEPTLRNFIDRTGEFYGRLTALFPVKGEKANRTKWLCQCSCGNLIITSGSDLKTKHSRSCGCLHTELSVHMNDKNREEMIGKRFGKLTVLSFEGVHDERAFFKCRCDCGKEIVVKANSLKSGNTTSCGCSRKEAIHKKYEEAWNSFIGTKINLLTATKFIGTKNGNAMFEFECECGNKITLSAIHVKSGQVKSCGCIGSSYGEAFISKLLDDSKILYKKQQAFEDLRTEDTNYLLHYDFAILNENNEVVRLIEYDGLQHFQPVSHFGGEEGFARRQYLDNLKNQYAISHNIPLTRIPYTEQDNLTLDLLFDDKYTITKQQE